MSGILYIHSLLTTRIVIADNLGLFSSLSPTFWVATALTILSLLSVNYYPRWKKLEFIILSFYALMLYLTPIIIGGSKMSPLFPNNSWGFETMVNSISQKGFVDPSLSFHFNWPGVWFLVTELFQVIGLKGSFTYSVVILAQFWLVIEVPLFYLIFRNLFHNMKHLVGPATIVSITVSWMLPAVIGNHALAFVLFLLFFSVFLRGDSGDRKTTILLLIIISTIVFTHFVTSLVLLSILAAMIFLRKKGAGFLFLVCLMLLTVWTIYVTASFFQREFSDVIFNAFRLENMTPFINEGTSRGSQMHHLAVYSRLLLPAIFGIISLSSIFLFKKFNRQTDKIVLVIAGAIGIVLVGVGASYGLELLHRVILLELIPIGYFAAKFFMRKSTRIILIVVLILTVPFFVIARNGNLPAEYVSEQAIMGSNFLENAPTAVLLSPTNQEFFDGLYVPTWKDQRFILSSFSKLFWANDKLVYNSSMPADRPLLTYVNNNLKLSFQSLSDDPNVLTQYQTYLNESCNVDVIYSNDDMIWYLILP